MLMAVLLSSSWIECQTDEIEKEDKTLQFPEDIGFKATKVDKEGMYIIRDIRSS